MINQSKIRACQEASFEKESGFRVKRPTHYQTVLTDLSALTNFITPDSDDYEIQFEDSQLPEILYSITTHNGEQFEFEVKSAVHCKNETAENKLEVLQINMK